MTRFRNLFLSLGLLAVAGVAQAAPMALNGDHFSVSYDDTQVGLFSTGLMSGSLDTVYFQPTTFNAFSGGAPASNASSLQLMLNIAPGYVFTGLTFTGRGDYFLSGGGAVDVTSSVKVTNQATSAFSVINMAPGSPLSLGGGQFWEIGGAMSLLSLGVPQTLLVTLDTDLLSAPVDGIGFIQNTYAGFRIETAAVPANIPEPASWALVMIGFVAATFVGMRRRVVVRMV